MFKREPAALLRLVAPTESVIGVRAAPAELVVKQAADAVAWVETDRGAYVLHAEFEIDPRDTPWRMLVYHVLLADQLTGRPPVRSVVFLLNRPPERFRDALALALPGESAHLRYRFEAVHLYALPAARLAADPALAQLAPLGAGFQGDRQGVVQRAAETICADATARADRLGVLSLLARARGLSRSQTRAIISMEEVRMGYAYHEILEEGIAKGREEGIAKGREEGRDEGRVQEARRMAASVLHARFGPNHGLDDLIDGATPEALERLVALVFQATSPDALRQLAGEE